MISNTFYFLCKYPEIQRKLRKEIIETLNGNEINIEMISKINYLNQVMNESLRLIPPVMMVNKETDEDTFLGDYFIPKDTMILINIWGLHRDPSIWENPTKFDPDRWNDENLKKIENLRYKFLPFSVGPRDCVGKIFAKYEAPLIISLILYSFEINFADGFNDIDLEFGSILKPKSLKLKFSVIK